MDKIIFVIVVLLAQESYNSPLIEVTSDDLLEDVRIIEDLLQEVGSSEDPPTPKLYPVILVPGDGGSQIEARLNKTSTAHFWCSKTSDWYDLWLNIEQMLTFMVDCWKENVKLRYNATSHTTYNAEGVDTRIPGFGQTEHVEYIDKSMRSFSVYFAKIVTMLLPLGYTRGKDLHGAPYDFRRAANEHGRYFQDVKKLVESTYAANGERKVVLVCHSMGCIMVSYFLNRQPQVWKDKHIRSLVSIAGVWGGTARAIKVFALGDNLDSWFLNEKNLLWERTNPSLAWLLPAKGFWEDNEVLVQTEEKNFTRTNLGDFFKAYNEPNFASMMDDTKDLLTGLPPPNVEVFCNHGSGIPTTERLVYPKGAVPKMNQAIPMKRRIFSKKYNMTFWPFPSYEPTLIKGDGDGTVNIRSLKGCLKWAKEQSHPLHYKVFEKTNHLDMLRTDAPAQYVADIVKDLNKELNQFSDTVELVEEKTAMENKGTKSFLQNIFEHIPHNFKFPIIEIL